MEDILIPLAAICMFLVGTLAFFGFFAYLRYLRYKENLAYAEKGLLPPRYRSNGKGTLRWGIVITALGLAFCVGLYPIGWIAGADQFPLRFGPWMLVGLIPMFFGLSLVAIYTVTRQRGESPDAEQMPSMETEDAFDFLPEEEDGSEPEA
jgi:hypothetical protein